MTPPPKQDIIKELNKIMPCTCLDAYKNRHMSDPECSWYGYNEDIADLIIKDRERIYAPLVKLEEENPYYGSYNSFQMMEYSKNSKLAIDETLKNAGIDTDK